MMKLTLRSFPGTRGLALLAALLIGISGQAAAGEEIEINQIVVFGDSLSDTGNVFTLTGQAVPLSPPWFEGRFTNGFVWHEVLAEGLGMMPASLPSFLGGLNYAFGGAELGAGFSATGTPNVGVQIDWYLSGIPPFPFLPAGPAGTPSSDQLFIVNGGNNDFIPPGEPADPVEAAQAVVGHITTLAAAGARHFLVPTSSSKKSAPALNPPLDALNLGSEPPEGFLEDILERNRTFNRQLRFRLSRLERQLRREYREPVTITFFNIDLAGRIIQNGPEWFGIENVTEPAVVDFCFCAGELPDGIDPDRFYYFDIVHPSAPVHEVFGELAALTLSWKLALANLRY